MVNIGMTPMESIVATTQTAAFCLGWEDQVGTIEAGKLADVLVVKTNPLQDIRSLENNDNIALVMKDGKVVKNLVT
jgi:imidazolonepropionase-like amidohydrolase